MKELWKDGCLSWYDPKVLAETKGVFLGTWKLVVRQLPSPHPLP